MELSRVQQLLGEVAAVPPGCRDRARLTSALTDLRRVVSYCQGLQVALTRDLAEVASFPEQDLAGSGRTSVREATRLVERGRTAAEVPEFGAALAAGRITGEHVDVLGRALRTIEPELRARLAEIAVGLVTVAEAGSPDDLRRRLPTEARRLRADGGISRLERQRRDARFRTWVDQATSMWCCSGRFDPLTGVSLDTRLRAQLDAIRAAGLSDTCPADPIERHHHVHDDHWRLTSHPDGTVTTTLPDGTTLRSPPSTCRRRRSGTHHGPDPP